MKRILIKLWKGKHKLIRQFCASKVFNKLKLKFCSYGSMNMFYLLAFSEKASGILLFSVIIWNCFFKCCGTYHIPNWLNRAYTLNLFRQRNAKQWNGSHFIQTFIDSLNRSILFFFLCFYIVSLPYICAFYIGYK